MIDTALFSLLVHQAKLAALHSQMQSPQPGDLVIEVSHFTIDPDAIGWLIGTGEAPYNEDGTGPTRLVWDVVPLTGNRGRKTLYQRWENAEFVKVVTRVQIPQPPEVAELLKEHSDESANSVSVS